MAILCSALVTLKLECFPLLSSCLPQEDLIEMEKLQLEQTMGFMITVVRNRVSKQQLEKCLVNMNDIETKNWMQDLDEDITDKEKYQLKDSEQTYENKHIRSEKPTPHSILNSTHMEKLDNLTLKILYSVNGCLGQNYAIVQLLVVYYVITLM